MLSQKLLTILLHILQDVPLRVTTRARRQQSKHNTHTWAKLADKNVRIRTDPGTKMPQSEPNRNKQAVACHTCNTCDGAHLSMQKIRGCWQEGKRSLFATFDPSNTEVANLPKKRSPGMPPGEAKLPTRPCCTPMHAKQVWPLATKVREPCSAKLKKLKACSGRAASLTPQQVLCPYTLLS